MGVRNTMTILLAVALLAGAAEVRAQVDPGQADPGDMVQVVIYAGGEYDSYIEVPVIPAK